MKLIFAGITLGGGPPYFIDNPLKQTPTLANIANKVPRTNYYRNVGGTFDQIIRSFTGRLVGSDVNDYRIKRRAFKSLLANTYTFILVDDYINSDGTTTIFAQYTFDGKVTSIDFQNEISNYGEYQILIACEDPTLYLLPQISYMIPLGTGGFTFPMLIPLRFGSANSGSLTIFNTGDQDIYPTYTVNGPGTNFSIEKVNDGGSTFNYSASLITGDQLVLTPNPTDPIKARKNGVSDLANTNNNFDALVLKQGENDFYFTVSSGADPVTTDLEIQFYLGYKGY